MVGKSVFGVGALMAASVTAQTAPDFPIQVSQQLGVAYGNNTVSPPGEKFPRPETANPPSINFSPSTPSPSTSRAVLLMVDTEVPQNNTRVQLIHWLATNITLSTTTPLAIPSPQPVPYLQPSPPVGDIPHTYSFLLYPQPDNFSIPAQYADLAQNRIGFNVTQFVADVGLTEPWAGNYITVQNLTGVAGNGTGGGAVFTGGVAGGVGGGVAAWVVGLGAVVVGGWAGVL